MTVSQTNTNGNMIQGNFFGTNAGGTGALANAGAGVEIVLGAQNNIIGGTTAAARNIISGNTLQGIVIVDSGTNGNIVEGNYIGLNAAGTSALGNGSGDPVNHAFYSGIDIFGGAQNNFIGGSVAGAGNVISGNVGPGMTVSQTNTNGNMIQGNFFGTNAAGTAAIGNGFADPAHGYLYAGVEMFGGAQSTTIGGAVAGAGNVISGNAAQGVYISDAGTNGTVVQGNIIGLNATGTSAIANGSTGVILYGGTTSNTVGGTMAGARNYISGNGGDGVVIAVTGTSGNLIQGNTIGLNFAGAAAGNLGRGVSIFGGATQNTIGGNATGAGNIITASGNEGIAMFDASDIRDAFSRNSIFANGAKGIALFNSANNSQPFPALGTPVLSTVGNPSGTDIPGSLTAAGNATYTIEFFASLTSDPSGFGEGQFFLGSTSVTTNGGGTGSFTASLGVTVPAGYVIAATATDSLGNTSEFSAVQSVVTTDTDGDGVPDNWMNAHFGHATGQAGDKSRATDDADGDGLTNAQEFAAGLDPKNPNSVLRITSVSRSGANVTVGFPSVSGKVYQLQFRGDLIAGNWNPLVDGILGTGATLQVTDASVAGLTRRFYRIVLRP